MSDYDANMITPDSFILTKNMTLGYTTPGWRFTISTGTVAFAFPSASQVDPNDWTRGTLQFAVPELFLSSDHYDVQDAACSVHPATWDLTSTEQPLVPGWGVDWFEAGWFTVPPADGDNTQTFGVTVRAGIVSKTGSSELLRCSYQVFSKYTQSGG